MLDHGKQYPLQAVEKDPNMQILDPIPPARQHVSILLLGTTGAGKSTFIATTSGHNVQIGHGLASCTVNCSQYDFEHNGTRITLIDSPGFDDTTRNDMDILTTIASYMGGAHLPPIYGIIYLHRITDKRLTGSARMNLEILKALCGQHFYPHVVLSTTMWGNVQTEDAHAECEERVKQLLESPSYWGDMNDMGASYIPFHGSKESGLTIIDHLLSRRPTEPTELQRELQNITNVEDTKAGSIIVRERQRREDRRQRELEEELAEKREQLISERNQLDAYGMANGQMSHPRRIAHNVARHPRDKSIGMKSARSTPSSAEQYDAENPKSKGMLSRTLDMIGTFGKYI